MMEGKGGMLPMMKETDKRHSAHKSAKMTYSAFVFLLFLNLGSNADVRAGLLQKPTLGIESSPAFALQYACFCDVNLEGRLPSETKTATSAVSRQSTSTTSQTSKTVKVCTK